MSSTCFGCTAECLITVWWWSGYRWVHYLALVLALSLEAKQRAVQTPYCINELKMKWDPMSKIQEYPFRFKWTANKQVLLAKDRCGFTAGEINQWQQAHDIKPVENREPVPQLSSESPQIQPVSTNRHQSSPCFWSSLQRAPLVWRI